MLEKVKAFPQWKNYASFIESRKVGLHDKADFFLERFVKEMSSRNFGERKEFAEWISQQKHEDKRLSKWVSKDLNTLVVVPTLKEWCELEPENPVPFRWLNTVDSLIQAIDLDPEEQIARYELCYKVLSHVDYNQHSLFDNTYLGDPEQDLGLLNLILLKTPGMTLGDPQKTFEEIVFRASTAEYFIQYQQLPKPNPISFLDWVSNNFPNFDYENYFTPVEPRPDEEEQES